MDGYRSDTYGDAFADVYDDWYHDVSDVTATAAFVAARCPGPLVELGSGTGRLAGPIRASGVEVVGLDASAAMLARSVAGHPDVPVVRGDMAGLPFRPGSVGTLLVAFNTLFNLPSLTLQRRLLQDARHVLRPDGKLVIEAFVPGAGAGEASDNVDVVRLDADLVVLRVSRTEPADHAVWGHHIELRDGAPVRLRPWRLRFQSVDGLDAEAAAAGLVLEDRIADWSGTPFDESCVTHVSVYGVGDTPR